MSYAFLDVQIGKSPSSRIVLELFEKDAPKTCQFFKSLLNHSAGYKGTRFHRVIEDFMIQGGDVKLEDDGPIGSAPTEMENPGHPVDKKGLVGLARTSAVEKNAQFFITLVPAEHLQGVHTIFGQVVKGIEVVDKIGHVEVDDADNPTSGNEVVIVGCGELQPRKPQQSPSRESSSPERQRKHSQHETETSPNRSGSRRRGSGSRRQRSVSPRRDRADHKRRSRSPEAEKENHGRRHHHHHHHHHRRHHRSPVRDEGERRRSHHREQSRSPDRPRDDGHSKSERRDGVPTGPREYKSNPHYRPESNYGRLGYDAGYDDERDDEYRLRAEERRREEERGRDEPTVIFKGRGAMKFRERNY